MTTLDEIAEAVAIEHGLDPAEFAARVRRQRARREQRGQQPAKRCSSCQRDRPALDFAEDARATDGLKSACRPCDAERVRARRSRLVVLAD